MGIFRQGNLCPVFRHLREGFHTSSSMVDSQLPADKNNPYAKVQELSCVCNLLRIIEKDPEETLFAVVS